MRKPAVASALLLQRSARIPAVAGRSPSVADFYKDKQIKIIVGNAAGGDYDLGGRILARHVGNHIPGNPAVVVQNMPGASTVIAAEFPLQQGAEGRHGVRLLLAQYRQPGGDRKNEHRGRPAQIRLDWRILAAEPGLHGVGQERRQISRGGVHARSDRRRAPGPAPRSVSCRPR